ncbi:MAG: secondary thiamine-phosphate synthase enzyme YjbQ [Pseudomonadota bacterium]
MEIAVSTHSKTEFIDMTARIQDAVTREGMASGLCMVYVPHTTAGVTINESADPSVQRDILMVLAQMAPERADYRHLEGNSSAHVKASLMGASALVAVTAGRLVLGTWQGIFFCEFDGPRTRKVHLRFIDSR